MKLVYTVAAIPIVTLVCLSVLAGYVLGDLQQIPMQWNLSGTPNWYAPKWIGLSVAPAIGIFATANLVISVRDKPIKYQIRDLIISGSVVVGCQILYLYLLMRHFF